MGCSNKKEHGYQIFFKIFVYYGYQIFFFFSFFFVNQKQFETIRCFICQGQIGSVCLMGQISLNYKHKEIHGSKISNKVPKIKQRSYIPTREQVFVTLFFLSTLVKSLIFTLICLRVFHMLRKNILKNLFLFKLFYIKAIVYTLQKPFTKVFKNYSFLLSKMIYFLN